MRPLGLSGHFFLSYSSGQFSLGGVPPSPYVSVVTTSSRANICCTIDDIQVIDSWRSMWLAGAGIWISLVQCDLKVVNEAVEVIVSV